MLRIYIMNIPRKRNILQIRRLRLNVTFFTTGPWPLIGCVFEVVCMYVVSSYSLSPSVIIARPRQECLIGLIGSSFGYVFTNLGKVLLTRIIGVPLLDVYFFQNLLQDVYSY